MIKLFRRIRLGLLKQNNTSKYLWYAIGEIALVIIGILIALFINDWNNERQLRKTEAEVLQSLALEFTETKKQIEICINGNDNIINTAKRFVVFCSEADRNINVATFDSLLFNTAWHEGFPLKQGVLNELINTGKLSLISDAHTRILLSEWTAQLKETKEREKSSLSYLHTMVIELMDKKVSWNEMTPYDPINPISLHNNKRNIDRYQLAKDLRIENFAINQAWFCESYNQAARELLYLNDQILEQIRNVSTEN